MNKSSKNLLAIHLNEFNYKFLLYGSKKYNCKNIKTFLNKKKIKTFSPDQIQDKDLDPWVQSISINIGKDSKNHKTFNIGERTPKKYVQIWDLLSKKKISSSIWGSMNSRYKKNKYIKLYFPDPWNYKDNAYPEKLNSFLKLPKYYAQNYLEVNKWKLFKYSFIFLFRLIFSKTFFYLLKNFYFFINILIIKGLKNYILFFILDLISINLLTNHIKNKRTEFSLIFLNSLAHFQHNNWDELNNNKIYFKIVDKICEDLIYLEKFYQASIIFNGFTQKKIKAEFIIRPINPKTFLTNLGIKYIDLQQNMTNGGFIFFSNKKEKEKSFKILSNYKFFGYKVFELKSFNKKTLIYRIQIKTLKKINKDNIDHISKKNIKNFVAYDKSLNNKVKFSKSKLEQIFIKDMFQIKTTGRHIPEGLLFYKNIKLKKSSKIKNSKIFNIIEKHFN